MPETVRIVPTREEFVASFREAVDRVARERRYLLQTTGFSLEQTRAFIDGILAGGGVQFLAVEGDRVVGWCDVVRSEIEGMQHCGRLGMGLLAEYRSRGLGAELLERAVFAASKIGIERVELEVFSTNARAIRLYERCQFQHEGLKRKVRRLDGIKDDLVLMVRWV